MKAGHVGVGQGQRVRPGAVLLLGLDRGGSRRVLRLVGFALGEESVSLLKRGRWLWLADKRHRCGSGCGVASTQLSRSVGEVSRWKKAVSGEPRPSGLPSPRHHEPAGVATG